jgi:tRNA nucleotidyltransferase (CCA-adding enzyme)
LMEAKPSRMFLQLRACGALARLLPEVDALWGVPQPPQHHPEVDTGVHLMMVLDMAARLAAPLAVRYACLCHDLGKAATPRDMLPRHIGHEEKSADLAGVVSERWRVSADCKDLADLVAREHTNIHRCLEFSAAALVRLLERCDAFRRPERFAQALLACECDARGRAGLTERPYPQRQRLTQALAAAQSVATKNIADYAMNTRASSQNNQKNTQNIGPQIAQAIHAARVQAVAQLLG